MKLESLPERLKAFSRAGNLVIQGFSVKGKKKRGLKRKGMFFMISLKKHKSRRVINILFF
jgi:hypothetical protein